MRLANSDAGRYLICTEEFWPENDRSLRVDLIRALQPVMLSSIRSFFSSREVFEVIHMQFCEVGTL